MLIVALIAEFLLGALLYHILRKGRGTAGTVRTYEEDGETYIFVEFHSQDDMGKMLRGKNVVFKVETRK